MDRVWQGYMSFFSLWTTAGQICSQTWHTMQPYICANQKVSGFKYCLGIKCIQSSKLLQNSHTGSKVQLLLLYHTIITSKKGGLARSKVMSIETTFGEPMTMDTTHDNARSSPMTWYASRCWQAPHQGRVASKLHTAASHNGLLVPVGSEWVSSLDWKWGSVRKPQGTHWTGITGITRRTWRNSTISTTYDANDANAWKIWRHVFFNVPSARMWHGFQTPSLALANNAFSPSSQWCHNGSPRRISRANRSQAWHSPAYCSSNRGARRGNHDTATLKQFTFVCYCCKAVKGYCALQSEVFFVARALKHE